MEQRVWMCLIVVAVSIVLVFSITCLSATAEKQENKVTLSKEDQKLIDSIRMKKVQEQSVNKEVTMLYPGLEKDQIDAFYNAWAADVQNKLGRFCYPTQYDLQSLLNITDPQRILGPDKRLLYAVTKPLKVTVSGTPIEFSLLVLNAQHQQVYHIVAAGNTDGLCKVNVIIEPVAVTVKDFERVANHLKTIE